MSGSFDDVLGIEEAKIFEDNMSLPGGAMAAQGDHRGIGDLIDKLIRPVDQKKGIEAFQAALADTSSGILDGNLRGDAALLSTSPVSDNPRPRRSKIILTGLISGLRNLTRSLRDIEIA